MNPAAINLLLFFILVLIVWGLFKLNNKRNLLQGKSKEEKTLTEDILKQLFHVEQSERTATIADLSGALKIKEIKILPLIEAMTSSGLLDSGTEALHLTNSGREYAIKIVRIHRLWEKYLAENTGHKPSEWHYLAEKMEHQLDDRDINKLSTSLGNPLFDPHGDPIPSVEGNIAKIKWTPLPSYPLNQPGKIVHIEDEPSAIYQQILAKRILVGSHIKIVGSSGSEVVFNCEGRKVSFSPIVAANISIEPLSTEEIYEENSIRLSALEADENAKVIGISQECRGANRRRLLDLGILPGTDIEVDLQSPLKDPIAYRVRNTSIALRNSLADLILINKMT
jgi:DtxR family Mn-dependent transcriptional regulator